jgi:hypothetical protein
MAAIAAPWAGSGGRTHLVNLLKAELWQGMVEAPYPAAAWFVADLVGKAPFGRG